MLVNGLNERVKWKSGGRAELVDIESRRALVGEISFFCDFGDLFGGVRFVRVGIKVCFGISGFMLMIGVATLLMGSALKLVS